MTRLRVSAGPFTFQARLEESLAPRTCAAFRQRLPFIGNVVSMAVSTATIVTALSFTPGFG